jgi:hypothetical protein
LLKFFQQRDQMMDTAVGLLRARFQQIVKLSVPADEFLNREHKRFLLPLPAGSDLFFAFSPPKRGVSRMISRSRA